MTGELIIAPAAVEIYLSLLALAVLAVNVFWPRHPAAAHWLAGGGLAAAAASSAATVASAAGLANYEECAAAGACATALHGFYVTGPLSSLLKAAAFLAAAASLLLSREYLEARGMARGEFYALAVFAALGMSVMISAAHLLSLYMGLELMSLAMYAMIAMRRDNAPASEAAIKYFVLGALASGMFLYGAAMLYGATGQLGVAAIAEEVAAEVFNNSSGGGEEGGGVRHAALVLGLVFLLAGMAFKLGAAPFHMWLPDVYQGAPTAVTLFIGAAPKVAAVAMLIRVLAEALGAMDADWRQMLMLMAVASLAIGNIAAIAQSNIKRMLAYSSIAHAGFMSLALFAGADGGLEAAVFYVAIYALMTVGGFGAVVALSRRGAEFERLDDFRGLASRNGVCALAVLLLMFSMAGIPPVAGFYAKFAVLRAVIDSGAVWLAVVALFFSLVGAFYYLRVVKLMYFDKPPPDAEGIALGGAATAALAFIAFLVLWLGLFPDWLMSAGREAVRVSL